MRIENDATWDTLTISEISLGHEDLLLDMIKLYLDQNKFTRVKSITIKYT